VTADPGRGPIALREYGVDGAFMSLLQRERGIHAVRLATGGARVTKVGFRVRVLRAL